MFVIVSRMFVLVRSYTGWLAPGTRHLGLSEGGTPFGKNKTALFVCYCFEHVSLFLVKQRGTGPAPHNAARIVYYFDKQ